MVIKVKDHPVLFGLEEAYMEVQGPVEGACQTLDVLKSCIEQLMLCDKVAVDTETSGVNVFCRLAGISLCGRHPDGKLVNFYVPVGHTAWDPQLDIETVREHLNPLLATKRLVMHVAQFDLNVLELHGFTVPPSTEVDDTFIESFLINENGSHKLKDLGREIFKLDLTDYADLAHTKKNDKDGTKLSVAQMTPYAKNDTKVTLMLDEYFMPKLMEDAPTYKWYKIEQRLVDIFRRMRLRGVEIDLELVKKLKKDAIRSAKALENKIKAALGEYRINLQSVPQLRNALIRHGLIPEATGTTDKETLKALADSGSEVCETILEYKSLMKEISSMYSPIERFYVEGRVHANLRPLATETTRGACSEPNLQQAKRPEKGKLGIRHCIVARPGYVLIDADLSQAEVRLMAHESGDAALTKVCLEADMHKHSAALMLGKSPKNVTKEERQNAKGTTFGELYKQSWGGLQRYVKRTYGIVFTDTEAKNAHEGFHQAFPGIRDYHKRIEDKVIRDGYVRNIFGLKRRPTGLDSPDEKKRSHAVREAINFPIQSGIGCIMKLISINLDRRLADFDCYMVLQVHDEILFECREDQVSEVIPIIETTMENTYKISVPMIAEAHVGKNWAEAK